MPTPLNLFNAAAGAMGSPYLAVLSFAAKAVGNYVINDTNFPGVGKYLPGWVFVAAVPAATSVVAVQISTDNGTTWKTLYNATNASPAGGPVFGDAAGVTGVGQGVSTSATVRVTIATAVSDIFLFPLLNA